MKLDKSMSINIFVEGHDSNFIEKYLNHILPDVDKKSYNIISTGGCTNIHGFENDFKENTNIDKGTNLVIFDADDESKDFGGIDARRKYLEDEKAKLGIEFEYFLFPNNESDGDYECLLEQIIHSKHKCLFTCFEGYQTCIDRRKDGSGNNIYNAPIRKTKIYAYVDSIKKSKTEEKRFKNNKKGDYLFDNPELWNLDNEYLVPLRDFLLKYFIE